MALMASKELCDFSPFHWIREVVGQRSPGLSPDDQSLGHEQVKRPSHVVNCPFDTVALKPPPGNSFERILCAGIRHEVSENFTGYLRPSRLSQPLLVHRCTSCQAACPDVSVLDSSVWRMHLSCQMLWISESHGFIGENRTQGMPVGRSAGALATLC